MINQFLLKVMSSKSPVLFEVHRQVARHELPRSVGHEACDVHFSHSGVNNRHAGLAVLPSLDELHVGLPAVESSIINTVSAEALVAVPHKPEFVEIAPEKLRDEVCAVRALAVFGDVLLCVMVHLPDGERAVSQPRRKFT